MSQTVHDATTAIRFQVNTDQGGPALHDESGAAGFRNDEGTAYVAVRGADPVGANDLQTFGQRGQPNGYPELDGTGQVPPSQLPDLAASALLVFESDPTVSSTSSGTYQTKLVLTTQDLPAASNLLFFASWRSYGSQNGTQHQVRVVLDLGLGGETVLYEQDYTGRDPVPVTPFSVQTLTGVHTFTIQYRRLGGGGSASIDEAEMVCWVVS